MLSRIFVTISVLAIAGANLVAGCVPLAVTGAAAGASMATDRRTSGAYIDDQAIELKAGSAVGKGSLAAAGHINITSYNRLVLVTGEVPTMEAKIQAIDIIRRVENVRTVYDELTVGPNSSMTSRAKDSTITGNVKQRIAGARGVSAGDVKVVTENRVVYLMGRLSQSEADAAADAASTTADVVKVVKVVEYIADIKPAGEQAK